ncbi:MAG: DNA/RNA nuclease SfsA [Halocynthiibacter sp.]
MRFQTPLVRAVLIRRYKRFLADMQLADGTIVTTHCPNPGAMLGLKDEGLTCWLEPNDDPKKKLKYGWRLAEMDTGAMVGIDTSAPNKIIKEALLAKRIPAFAAYDTILPEQKYSTNSRIDFLLRSDGLPDLYLEVKNAHLMRQEGLAEFPDCETKRGAKHLADLSAMSKSGHRAATLYLIQRDDCHKFGLAGDLDPTYSDMFQRAKRAGMESFAYNTILSQTEIAFGDPIPFE